MKTIINSLKIYCYTHPEELLNAFIDNDTKNIVVSPCNICRFKALKLGLKSTEQEVNEVGRRLGLVGDCTGPACQK